MSFETAWKRTSEVAGDVPPPLDEGWVEFAQSGIVVVEDNTKRAAEGVTTARSGEEEVGDEVAEESKEDAGTVHGDEEEVDDEMVEADEEARKDVTTGHVDEEEVDDDGAEESKEDIVTVYVDEEEVGDEVVEVGEEAQKDAMTGHVDKDEVDDDDAEESKEDIVTVHVYVDEEEVGDEVVEVGEEVWKDVTTRHDDDEEEFVDTVSRESRTDTVIIHAGEEELGDEVAEETKDDVRTTGHVGEEEVDTVTGMETKKDVPSVCAIDEGVGHDEVQGEKLGTDNKKKYREKIHGDAGEKARTREEKKEVAREETKGAANDPREEDTDSPNVKLLVDRTIFQPPTDGCGFDPMQVDEEDCSFALSVDSDWDMLDSSESNGAVDLILLAQILEQGKAATASIGAGADVVLVLGCTGVGKSTFMQAVAGHSIVCGFDESLRKASYVVDGEGEEGFEIGHGMVSQTRHVRSYFREETSTFYVDSTGFGDTKCIEADIATSISVKQIASRAGKLRFVILVNAYAFYSNRATEVKKNLDLVAKFVGHNFDDHKKSFSFLFTHCNKAFEPVASINDDNALSSFRNELLHLLSETKKATREVSARKLISFLHSSLDKNYPFCDVFDPILSDLKVLRKNMEPTTRNAILQPAQHVICSLTSSATIAIDHELRNRMASIESRSEEACFDVAFRDDVLAVCTLAAQTDRSFCHEQARALMLLLTRSIDHLKTTIFQLAKEGLLDSNVSDRHEFALNAAKKAKQAIYQLNALSDIVGQCQYRLAGGTVPDTQKPDSVLIDQLMNLFQVQMESTQTEFSNIEGYLHNAFSGMGSGANKDTPPDIRAIAARLQKASAWADVFAGDFQKTYLASSLSLGKRLRDMVSRFFINQPTIAEGPRLLRLLAIVKASQENGLLDCLIPKEDENGHPFWQKCFGRLVSSVRDIKRDLPLVVQRATDSLNSPQIATIEHPVFFNLQRILHNIEVMDSTIKESDLRDDVGEWCPRQQGLTIVLASFQRTHEECTRRILELGNQTGLLLEMYFFSLQALTNSLTASMRSEGNFTARFHELWRLLGKELAVLAGNLNVVASHLESSTVSDYDMELQKRHLGALNSCAWFDDLVLLYPGIVEEPFVARRFLEIVNKYSSYGSNVAASMKQPLLDILSEQNNESTILDHARCISMSVRTLKTILSIAESAASCNVSFSKVFREQVQHWCNQKLEAGFSASVKEIDSQRMEKYLLIAEALKDIDVEANGCINEVICHVNDKLDVYRSEINTAVEKPLGYKLKGCLLDHGKIWSGLRRLRLPSYDTMCRQVRDEVVTYAEQLNRRIIDADDDSDLANIDDDMQPLFDAEMSVGKHLQGTVTHWIGVIEHALEVQKNDIDHTFNELVQNNDFKTIQPYLLELQDSNPGRNRRCLRLLSRRLWQIVKAIRRCLDQPHELKAEQIPELDARLSTLRAADSVLSSSLMQYPPPSLEGSPWSLKEEICRTDQALEDTFRDMLEAVVGASQKFNILSAFNLMKCSILLEQLLVDGDDFERTRGMARATARTSSLLVRVDKIADDFISKLSACESSATKSTPFPNGSLLYATLHQLKYACAQKSCPAEIQRCYQNTTENISRGLDELVATFKAEAAEGKFARSFKTLGFLRAELAARGGLVDHVEVSFDVSATIGEFVNAKVQQHKSMGAQLTDEKGVEEIAKRLESLSTWYRRRPWSDDYDDYRNTVTKAVDDFVTETVDKIENHHFIDGIGSRLVLIYVIQTKLRKHLKLWGLLKLVMEKLGFQLSRLTQDVKMSLQSNSGVGFDKLFTLFHNWVLEISRMQSRIPFLVKLQETCQKAQKEIHHVFLIDIQKRLCSFKQSLGKQDYRSASHQAIALQVIGYFLLSKFEVYQEETCTGIDDSDDLRNIISLRLASFGGGKLLVVGKSIATLRLSNEPNFNDVRRAFKTMSLRVHPDKNPGDKLAKEKFAQIKDAADVLEDKRNLKVYRDHDFGFIAEAVLDILRVLRSETKRALEDGDFKAAAAICSSSVEDIQTFAAHVKDEGRTQKLSVQHLQTVLFDDVKMAVDALVVDIENACSNQDFVLLHHSFGSLASLESVFKVHREVVPTSLTSRILADLNGRLQGLQNEAELLRDKSEREADKGMDDFAMQLIKMGRYFDGFPRLKKKTAGIIHRLLNGVHNEPWGVSFLFKLGLLLENGDVPGSEDDIRVGRVVVGAFPHFQDVRTLVFNREVVTADLADSIAKTTTSRYHQGQRMESVSIERQALKKHCERYQELFNSSFREYVQTGQEELIQKVFTLVQELGPCEIANWNNVSKSTLTEIVAGIFATFTIIKSGDSFRRFEERDDGENSGAASMDILFRPHNIQVIAIFRLLGIGSNEKSLSNHIMEIRTGEGKSLILGALSVVLAMLGFSTRCVCYSEHLSERDYELFKDIFVAFNVENRIHYSKLTTMSEDIIAEQGDIRQLTTNLVTSTSIGNPRSPQSLPRQRDAHRTIKGPGHISNESSWAGVVGTSAIADEQSKANTVSVVTTYSSGSESNADVVDTFSKSVDGAPLPLNGEDILLVDEVDVFFGPDFYGQTYNQVAEIENPLVVKFMRKLWKCRKEKLWLSLVKRWPEYIALQQRFKDWTLQVEKEVRNMIADVTDEFNDPPYEVDGVNLRIGYSVVDSIEWDLTFGYRTAFAYLYEAEREKLRGAKLDGVLRRALCLRISCGQFSYANISPSAILGVSGTLHALSNTERDIVHAFGVDTHTHVPSVYGMNNLIFDKFGRGILIETEPSRHLQAIANEMHQAVSQGRAVIAFFESEQRLLEFSKSTHWRKFRHANILSSTLNKEERKYVINKAATSKQVTIATAAFGRGTDFFCKDSQLEAAGGMLVIQTFLSVQRSEELQIQGRTARQGKKGTYCMILLESDLVEAFQMKSAECSSKAREDLYELLDQTREKVHAQQLAATKELVLKVEERDRESRAYLNALAAGDTESAKTGLTALYAKIELKFCRMVCMLDATNSMWSVWDSTKSCLSEMLRRIDDIGQGQFELLFVAYRDYASDRSLLEKSTWTRNPEELVSFVSGVQCGWGLDGEEAVEWALKEVNDEHEKTAVTRALLIGDAPPHFEARGEYLEWHKRALPTDYRHESDKLKANGIPVYTFRLNDKTSLVETFNYIAETTGGESHFLDVNASDSAKKLIDIVCETALEDIGGAELIAEYRARTWDY